MKRITFFSFVLLFSATALVLADTVTLKTGKVIECDVLEETPIFVRIREYGTEMTMREILVEQVQRIDRAPVSEQELEKEPKDKKAEFLRQQVEEMVSAPITGLHAPTAVSAPEEKSAPVKEVLEDAEKVPEPEVAVAEKIEEPVKTSPVAEPAAEELPVIKDVSVAEEPVVGVPVIKASVVEQPVPEMMLQPEIQPESPIEKTIVEEIPVAAEPALEPIPEPAQEPVPKAPQTLPESLAEETVAAVPDVPPAPAIEAQEPVVTGPPEVLTNETIQELTQPPPEQIPGEPSTTVEEPTERAPVTAPAGKSGSFLKWLILLLVIAGATAVYFLKRKGRIGIVSDKKETADAGAGSAADKSGQPAPARRVHPSISATGRPLQRMKPLPEKEEEQSIELKGKSELPQEPGKITFGQVKFNLKSWWQVAIAAVVLMAILSNRVMSFKDKTDDAALMSKIKTHITSDYLSGDVEKLKAAFESGNDAAIHSVVTTEPEILSVQASYPLLNFSSNKKVVVKVVYALNDGSGTRETRTLYLLFKHNFLANHWSYQYDTTGVHYYLNFLP